MADIRRTVGGRVRELRQRLRLTQEALGERAHLSYKFIGEVERGVGNPTIETLSRLADALGVNPEELVSAGSKSSARISQLSPDDYAAVRDARESLETLLRRLGPDRSRRPK